MRIGLISFEYPPDTAVGGIATYTKQWASILQNRGHDVEVFAASPDRELSAEEDGIFLNLIKTEDRLKFKFLVVNIFKERNHFKPFEVIESAEFNTDASEIKTLFPALLLVVKLHTPSFLLDKVNGYRVTPSYLQKARLILGAWRRFQKPVKHWNRSKEIDRNEINFLKQANLIVSPSIQLARIVSDTWKISFSQIHILPNPYSPDQELLKIPIRSDTRTITFIGRLEKLKGIVSFIKIIPQVVDKYPLYKFRFVGRDNYLKELGISAKSYLRQQLQAYQNNIDFYDAVPLNKVPVILAETDICIFPSLWDNFPNVCLEAMAAGRAIVGSKHGGMNEMLQNPRSGILINPYNEAEIAEAICQFIESKELRYELGLQARKSVCGKYNSQVIGEAFEKLISEIKR